jgi:1-acyl-sn-glycerol-3-phosphate acyltransferase
VSLDGFVLRHKDAFEGFSESMAERAADAIDHVGRKLHVEVDGIEHLPPGRAVLVANHAFGFWDLALAISRVRAVTGRTVWALGEHVWWKVPFARRLASAVGVVDGTPENADALLGRGQLVLVLPGGLREALKPCELRYRLLWGHRYGFVRAAMRNDAPLVPLACIGGDDIFDLRGDAFARGRRWHAGVPLPLPVHLWKLPRRARLRFVVGEAIDVSHRGDAADEHAVRSVRREVEGALHEILEEELARRIGFTPGACNAHGVES